MATGVPRQIPPVVLQPAVEPHICVRCCKAGPRVGPCTKENGSVNCTYCQRHGNKCRDVRYAAAPTVLFSLTFFLQIPEALWPRARGAIRIYAEGRNAEEGTPQYEYAEDVARAFNCQILGYNRELKRRYLGGRQEILAEEQLEQYKLTNAIALAQVSSFYL